MGEISRHKNEEPLGLGYENRSVEHLEKSIKPIMACITNPEAYHSQMQDVDKKTDKGMDVSYSSPSYGSKTCGGGTYVISPIDSRLKFSIKYHDCTGVVAVGRDKKTGEEISFLTHQDPKKLKGELGKCFDEDLEATLKDFKNKCQEGTVDIVIAGGQYSPNEPRDYQKTIERLDEAISKVFKFEPLVIMGPKTGGSDDIIFDTENRRLYVIRPDEFNGNKAHNESFRPSQIETMKGKWKNQDK